jgi:hypothetical protein
LNECIKALASKLSSSSGVASQLKAVKDRAEAEFELIAIVVARLRIPAFLNRRSGVFEHFLP